MGLQSEEGKTAPVQILEAAGEIVVKACRNPFKGSHRWSRIKIVDSDQMNLTGAECIGTSDYFADVEGRL